MTDLSIRERVRLSRVRRELHEGKRSEMLCDPLERARLEFTGWRIRQGLACDCGRSDGEGPCHCDDGTFTTNYG